MRKCRKMPRRELYCSKYECRERESAHSIPDTLKERTYFPDRYWSFTAKLTNTHFKEEDRDSHENQRYHIWNQKCTSTIPITKVRKSPNIAKAHCKAEARQKEFNRVVPCSSRVFFAFR